MRCSTKLARLLIPEEMPHVEAVANSSCAALPARTLMLLSKILWMRPWITLYQGYRVTAMEPPLCWWYLRSQGFAGGVSALALLF